MLLASYYSRSKRRSIFTKPNNEWLKLHSTAAGHVLAERCTALVAHCQAVPLVRQGAGSCTTNTTTHDYSPL